MPLSDLLQALVVVVVWGLNFLAIKWGVGDMPPLLLAAMRYALAAFPALLLIKKPALPWRWMIAYAATVGVGQMGLLFTAIKLGMPTGLASVVMQSQAFFTTLIAAAWLKERWQPAQMLGLACAAGGLVLIGMAKGGDMTGLGLLLTLGGALSWAVSNVVIRACLHAGYRPEPLALVVWSGLVPPVPLLLLSLWLDGPAAVMTGLTGMTVKGVLCIAYLAFAASLTGYGLWSRLLARHPANKVAPFSLLVPVVGIAAAVLVLGEHLSSAQAIGSLLLMTGLLINVFGTPVLARLGWQGGRA
jgi:O-acetylserine/cysteine efflux transporter